MVYSTTPFASIKNIPQKIRSILSEEVKISYPPLDNELVIDVIKICLQRNPQNRPTTKDLLTHPFLA